VQALTKLVMQQQQMVAQVYLHLVMVVQQLQLEL
jgi:hypothetical protein